MTQAPYTDDVETRVANFARQHLPPVPRAVERTTLVSALALGHITPALASLFAQQDGLMVSMLDVFDLSEARQHAANPAIQSAFPGAVLFGWDRSGYLFFEDAKNSMDRGAGAIFAVDKIYIGPGTCILCALDLASFLEASVDDRPPWFAPRLIDQQTKALRHALAEHPERVETRPPKSPAEIAEGAQQAGVALGAGHLALLSISDGLLFPATGQEVFGVQDLQALPFDGFSRFGTAPSQPLLAITGLGANRPVDLVLEMTVETDAAASPSLGRVLDVVTRWVRGTDEGVP